MLCLRLPSVYCSTFCHRWLPISPTNKPQGTRERYLSVTVSKSRRVSQQKSSKALLCRKRAGRDKIGACLRVQSTICGAIKWSRRGRFNAALSSVQFAVSSLFVNNEQTFKIHVDSGACKIEQQLCIVLNTHAIRNNRTKSRDLSEE